MLIIFAPTGQVSRGELPAYLAGQFLGAGLGAALILAEYRLVLVQRLRTVDMVLSLSADVYRPLAIFDDRVWTVEDVGS
jgi:glycerol uptake facilitator-like aquaporin